MAAITFKGVLREDEDAEGGDEVFVQVLDLNDFLNAAPGEDIPYTDAAGAAGWAKKSEIDWQGVVGLGDE